MEEHTTKQEQNIHIDIKDKRKLDNELNEDDSSPDIFPEVNLREPEPHEAILKWAERNIGENPDTKLELIEELRDMIFRK